MKLIQVFSVAACWLLGSGAGLAVTVTWDGGGGDFSWQNPTNWSADVLPGVDDDVVIHAAGDVTITSDASATILSLQCSNSLALTAGTFRVRSEDSIVQGRLTATGNPVLSVTGALTSFTVVGPVHADGAGFEAIDATLSLPGLTNYSKGTGCAAVSWRAGGSTAMLNFPALTAITGAACANLTVQAVKGGTVQIPGLLTVMEGSAAFLADGTNSLLNLPVLEQCLAASKSVTFEARNAGNVAMPKFRGGRLASVLLSGNSTLPVAQLEELGGFTVSGMTVNFPALTNLKGGQVIVNAGGTATVPSLISHAPEPGCFTHGWHATGPGSVLDLSSLTSLSGPSCGWLNIEATAGGTVILSNLTTITEGTLNFLADGTDSRVDLGGLERSSATLRDVTFEARNAGNVAMPMFRGGRLASVLLSGNSTLPVAQLEELGGFTVSGMTVNFPALTNLAGGQVIVRDGGTATVPSLISHAPEPGCFTHGWHATGPGSVLDLSSLTSLSGPSCGWLNIEATAGGTVILSNLTTITEGTLNFLADGTDSRVDLDSLQQSLATLRAVSLEARNNGTLTIPLMQGGPTVAVAIKSGGSLEATQFNLLKGLTVSGTSLELPGITNLFAGDLVVEQGGVLTLPGLFNHDQRSGCNVNHWLADGPGSVLDLSSLTNLVGGSCGNLALRAQAGGIILATNLQQITRGAVDCISDGPDSLIGLHSLSNFLSESSDSMLIAADDGTLLLNDQPLFLSGVEVDLAAGTPGHSAIQLAATNLVMHGNAWRSYQVEARNTTSPDNPWQFFRRIPLTNDFQIIAPPAVANREFRGWEFVAVPFALELTVRTGEGLQPVLYGPANQAFEIETTTNLTSVAVWELYATVQMTNTFRIFSPESMTTPQRYFRVARP